MRSMDPVYVGYELIATLPPNSTSYRDTGLSAGQHYFYLVGVTYPQDPYDDYHNYWATDVLMPGP